MKAFQTKTQGEEVHALDRSQEHVDESHDLMHFTMQGVEERDRWQRVFPDPIPSTHEPFFVWHDMKLTIGVRLKAAAPDGAGETPVLPKTDPLGTKTIEDLKTIAAEKSIAVDPKWTKAKLIAEILKAGK